MGIESLQPKSTFGLEELGLLDTTPLKSIDTIVNFCADATNVRVSAFMVFDDKQASLVVRSAANRSGLSKGVIPTEGVMSASSIVRERLSPVSFSNLAAGFDTADALERRKFGASAYLGAPVFGPLGEVVGVLATLTPDERTWTKDERERVKGYAFLLSEQIMLRAALETVKLMARERDMGGPHRLHS